MNLEKYGFRIEARAPAGEVEIHPLVKKCRELGLEAKFETSSAFSTNYSVKGKHIRASVKSDGDDFQTTAEMRDFRDCHFWVNGVTEESAEFVASLLKTFDTWPDHFTVNRVRFNRRGVADYLSEHEDVHIYFETQVFELYAVNRSSRASAGEEYLQPKVLTVRDLEEIARRAM